MKVFKLITVLTLLLSNLTVLSQDFELPKNIDFIGEDGYKKYEDVVIDGINWLEVTPVNE